MKITVLGTRGIPEILGGVETHCAGLYPELVKKGCEVTLIRRTPYVEKKKKITSYKGIKIIDIYAPKIKSIEAIVHTFLGIVFSRFTKTDILHIHAIGPSLMVPFAKLIGLKVVVTNHGPDYDRKKWGKFAKKFLILGEKWGTKYADSVIVISDVINSILKTKYNRHDCSLIYNGVNLPIMSISTDYISSLDLFPKKYIIAVGRFVEEKGFYDLIEAYIKSNINQKLVIVGDADHKSKYSKLLKKKAKENGIVLTGFIKGEKLNQIYTFAKLFVMTSYHEGLPIALLEAMSYNLDVLVSDIPANLEIELDKNNYFSVGNIEELKSKLIEMTNNPTINNFENIIIERYNWGKIANSTFELYEQCLNSLNK